MSDVARAVALTRAIVLGCADRVNRLPFGHAVLTPTLGRVWDANLVLAERWEGSAEELAEASDRVLADAGVAHRKTSVLDQPLVDRLWPGVQALDRPFRNRLVLMAARRAPDRPPDPAIGVDEADWPEWDAARAEGMAGEPYGDDPETVGQLLELDRRTASVVELRRLVARVDGEIAAYAELYLDRDARVAQVEDVVTLPEHRGRGLARAVVLRGVVLAREAGCNLVFLVADDDDWPKELYARLGFDPIGHELSFGRPPSP